MAMQKMNLLHLLTVMGEHQNRFLKTEILRRWPIDPDRVCTVDVTRLQLATLLRANLAFSNRRACVEADTFLSEFSERLRRAKEDTVAEAFEVGRPFAA